MTYDKMIASGARGGAHLAAPRMTRLRELVLIDTGTSPGDAARTVADLLAASA